MIANFYVTGSDRPRPSSRRTIFCDGSADDSYREGMDLELSHWSPNRTPLEVKADTSTEICMRFTEQADDQEWDLAINNHLDVDGLLSVYTVTHAAQAARHRRTIVEAAEMGDFWGWGELPAQWLCQGLTMLMEDLSDRGTDILDIYRQCFDAIPSLLKQEHPLRSDIEDGLAHLRASVEMIESGTIERHEHGDRFSHYRIPARVAKDHVDRALYVPAFNERLSGKCLLWPQARARWDDQRVCLVSIDSGNGWYYDLWYPGYTWADTADRWRAPGIEVSNSAGARHNEYERFNHEPLTAAIRELQSLEPSDGQWTIMHDFKPFDSTSERDYPVIASFLKHQSEPMLSRLSPEIVAARLARAFD